MQKLEVPQEAAGTRIDVFISENASPVLSRSAVQKILGDGKAFVERAGLRKTVRKNYAVKAGDLVFFEPCLPPLQNATPEDIPLDIVYEDQDIIVVNKPKGMVVHPAPGNYEGTLVSALLFHAKSRLSKLGGDIRPGIVHRLDKDTSGLMVVAKNDFAHAHLAGQLLDKSMGRVYIAVVFGQVAKDEFSIDLPIGRHPKERKKMAVDMKKGKPAKTHVRVLQRFPKHSLIEAKLATGRTHQIRVHLAYVNHPVLGDEVYGANNQGFSGQILHASRLSLLHPRTAKPMEFYSPLPEYFTSVMCQ